MRRPTAQKGSRSVCGQSGSRSRQAVSPGGSARLSSRRAGVMLRQYAEQRVDVAVCRRLDEFRDGHGQDLLSAPPELLSEITRGSSELLLTSQLAAPRGDARGRWAGLHQPKCRAPVGRPTASGASQRARERRRTPGRPVRWSGRFRSSPAA
ncbi:hypothetical protein GCM10010430_22370 [Kitasatospora cystarginea]|uniref:Resolvase/invertase-type recombinase catalytic domain-containing protein n=1 Tax=Kitasatospora cystarginea TaxID=58350 RepID=A0ABP5QMP5_9ACTN